MQALLDRAQSIGAFTLNARHGWHSFGRVLDERTGKTFSSQSPLHAARNVVLATSFSVGWVVACAIDARDEVVKFRAEWKRALVEDAGAEMVRDIRSAHTGLVRFYGERFNALPVDQQRALIVDVVDVMQSEHMDAELAVFTLDARIWGKLESYGATLVVVPRRSARRGGAR